MNARHGLSTGTVEKIRETLACFPEVEKAVLYGSRANGTAREGSDIDLVLFGVDLNERVLSRIEDAFDDLLLPYRMDISISTRISHADLLDHIRRVGVTLYEKIPATSKA